MTFLFVDNTTVQNNKARKLIRSHCMKGKNVGKTRASREQLEMTKNGVIPQQRPQLSEKGLSAEQLAVGLTPSDFSDRFAGVSFPAPLSTRMHELLYRCKLLNFPCLRLIFC
jgi:hypothetical protein